jgi:TolA-binding protein
MKSIERHRIKEDQFVVTLQETFGRIEQNRKQVLTLGGALVIFAIAVGGFLWWRQQTLAKASTLLADAMAVAEAPVTPPPPPPGSTLDPNTPKPPANSYANERDRAEAALPKFLAAADAYPSTLPGLAARYLAATTLAALGRDAEAEQRYQEVIARAGSGLYGRVARLGIAEVQARQKKYEPAINTLKELSTTAKDDLPLDGVLMQLGRTYALAGRKAEAVQAYERVTTEFPSSAYAGDARKEIDALKSGA